MLVIGARVKKAREVLEWSQRRLADESDVHFNTVNNLELGRGDSVQLSTLHRIAEALGTTIEALVAVEDDGKRRRAG